LFLKLAERGEKIMTYRKSLAAGALATQAADWQPVPGNLMTR